MNSGLKAECHQQIASFAHLQPGWGGEDCDVPPSALAIETSQKVLEQLPGLPDDISADVIGGVVFGLYKDSWQAFISVSNTGTVILTLIDFDSNNEPKPSENISNRIPEAFAEISEFLKRQRRP